MDFKTIYLFILAIFFLGILLYDFFIRNGREGLMENPEDNVNINLAINQLLIRIKPDGSGRLSDATLLSNFDTFGSFGSKELDDKVSVIKKRNSKLVDKINQLSELFGVPPYTQLNDSLVIYYDFVKINNKDTKNPKISNVSLNVYNDVEPYTYDANIRLGKTNQTNITNILSNIDPIVNNSHMQFLGGMKIPSTQENGAYLAIPTLPTFHGDSFLGLSFSFWAKYNSNTGTWSRFFDFGNGPGRENILIVNNIGDEGTIMFYIEGKGIAFEKSRINLTNDVWVHIVWSISSSDGEWKIYFNNELISEKEMTAIPSNTVRNTNYIGRSEWVGIDSLYNGKIADFRIYQRELNAEDVNLLYNLGQISTNKLPKRINVNLVKNGTFFSPRVSAPMMSLPTKWTSSSSNNTSLYINSYRNQFSNRYLMSPTFGYAGQFCCIINVNTKVSDIQQKVKIQPNTTYEFSFLCIAWMSNSDKQSYITANIGCFAGIGSDKSIIPQYGIWKHYGVQFSTDESCSGEETLKIVYNSASGTNGCGITSISIRKLSDGGLAKIDTGKMIEAFISGSDIPINITDTIQPTADPINDNFSENFDGIPTGELTRGFKGWTIQRSGEHARVYSNSFYGTSYADPVQNPNANGRSICFLLGKNTPGGDNVGHVIIQRIVELAAGKPYYLHFYFGTRTGSYYNPGHKLSITIHGSSLQSKIVSGMTNSETLQSFSFTVSESKEYNLSFMSFSGDKIQDSCIIIRNIKIDTNPPPAPPPPPAEPVVTLYEHGNYTGRSFQLGVGTHDFNVINGNQQNDRISSVKIPSGLVVVGYEHNPGQGRAWTMEGDNSFIGNIGANDTISSVVISKKPVSKEIKVSGINENNAQTFKAPSGSTFTGSKLRYESIANPSCGGNINPAVSGLSSINLQAYNSVYGDPCGGQVKRIIGTLTHT